MIIEAILAGFLGLGLPPATVAQRCDDYSSIKPGCNLNTGGARDANSKGDKGRDGGKGKK